MSGIYWLASYPKSGNTWFRAFLRNLQEDGDAPVDINELQTGNIASARGWLDEVLGFDTAELSPDEVERLRPAVYRWSAAHDDGIGYHKIHDAYIQTIDGEPLVSHEASHRRIGAALEARAAPRHRERVPDHRPRLQPGRVRRRLSGALGRVQRRSLAANTRRNFSSFGAMTNAQ